ncbi:FAD-dependent monooxygenase [Kineosporia babensis]
MFATIGVAGPPAVPPVRRLGTAVVIGASMAGLLTARVLADHAETVLVVDRDDLSGPRKGVPQSGQAHVLLAAGAEHLERWFPGFVERAVAAGACRVTTARVQIWDDRVPRANGSEVLRLAMTRPFLEELVRRELQAVPNVKISNGRVSGLTFEGAVVSGVQIEDVCEPADFVVDASGRSSKVGDWLEAAGFSKPPMVRVASGVNYSTALFRREPGEVPIGLGMAVTGTTRGGASGGAIFMTVEGDRWMVVQGGYGAFRPGATNQDMVERCLKEYPAPFGRVAENEMLGDVVTYRFPDNRRRDYWACERLPARLAVVGDAAASFNPIYGQGISSAALQAAALSIYLSADPDLDVPAREFFRMQKVVVDAAWAIATSGDAAGDAGAASSLADRVRGWLVGRVVANRHA